MRTIFTACLACILLSPALRASEFPYEAVVTSDETDVLAGPGRRYYATHRLARGERVEVHRREVGGWLAIRPPEGSFSWIPASQLKLVTEPDLAETTEDGVASWIGSRTQKVREHKSHIALDRGELVQLLGEKTVQNEAGEEETWYKIAPPTGEFRFIHHRDVSRVLAQDDHPPTPPASEPPAKPELPTKKTTVSAAKSEPKAAAREPASFAEVRPRESPKPLPKVRSNITLVDLFRPAPERTSLPVDDEVQTAAAESTAPPLESPQPKGPAGDGFQVRKAKRNEATPTLVDRTRSRTDEVAPRIASLPTKDNSTKEKEIAKPLAVASTPRSKPATPRTSIDPSLFHKQLDELDLELSTMVAGQPATWNLSQLRQKVELLVEDGPTAADRGQARLLLDRIHKFAESFNVEDDAVRALLPGVPVANSSTKPAETPKLTAVSSAADPKYDGQGWLKPVLSREKPAAPFAVVDDDGKPLAFVTPSPGLNLNRYVNKKVGLYGQRGYLEALKTPHIVAQRVIDLERHLR